MVKERENNSKDMYHSNEDEGLLVRDINILERWKDYYQKLIHDYNPREGRNDLQAEVEVDITNITSAEIEMAVRNMNSGKATGPVNLQVEVWKGRIGVNFLKDALNKITDEEKIRFSRDSLVYSSLVGS